MKRTESSQICRHEMLANRFKDAVVNHIITVYVCGFPKTTTRLEKTRGKRFCFCVSVFDSHEEKHR